MKKFKLRVLSDHGADQRVEATISPPARQGEAEDYYVVISIDGLIEDKKIYGIDPLQSFVLGLGLIEELTQDKRIGEENNAATTPGAPWRIEVVEG